MFAGTRGEFGSNGSFLFRRAGLAFNVNAGFTGNEFTGEGYSVRQNFYSDSTNFLKTFSGFINRSLRPNFRASLDYEITRFHLLNVVLMYNQNRSDNDNGTTYQNINRFDQIYRLSHRTTGSTGYNFNPHLSVTYTLKTKTPGEALRLFTNINYSGHSNERLFYQQFLNPDNTFNGNDSTQLQATENLSRGYNI